MPIIADLPASTDSVRSDLAAMLIGILDAAGVDTYLIDDLKGMNQLPANYAELHLSTRGRGDVRRAGRAVPTGYRAQVRVVCGTVGNAYLALDRADTALTGRRITVAGQESTPLDAQPSDLPAEDDGYYSALAEWTFTL